MFTGPGFDGMNAHLRAGRQAMHVLIPVALLLTAVFLLLAI
jgi:hypothetical protein